MNKTAQIKQHLTAGNIDKALAIAAKFFDRSSDTLLFKKAASAALNPGFYRQLGKNPDEIIAKAKERITEKFA